jgi:hypothetical protein
MNPITLDRSTLERYANCPFAGYVLGLLEALIAQAKGEKLFDWEVKRLAEADPKLIESLMPYVLCGMRNLICESGVEIHKIIDLAFETCKGDLEQIPSWIEDELPKCRPDLQPEVIVAGRHVCDKLADLHVKVLGTEVQMDYVLFPETSSRQAIVVTQSLDLVCQGLNNSLHIIDWKTGWKHRTNSEAFDSFQAIMAALLCWKQRAYQSIEKIYFRYIETRTGEEAWAIFERSEVVSPLMPHLTYEIAFEKRIEETAKLMMSDCRVCYPMDKKCLQCDITRWCPHVHVSAKDISDDPKAFIDKLIVDEASVKKRKNAAVEWVKAKGPIVGTKAVFARKTPQNRFTCELEEIQTGRDYSKTIRPETPASTGDSTIDSFFNR